MTTEHTKEPAKKHYFVSAIDGTKKYIIAGPYHTHEAALNKVKLVNEKACAINGRAHFMAWGTCGSNLRLHTPMGVI